MTTNKISTLLLRIFLDQNSSLCDLWLGFGSPGLPNWGCDANNVPLHQVCDWEGLTCHGTCNLVEQVYLLGHDFTGTISPSLGQLTAVTYLVIESSPQLHGTLPPSIGALSNLSILHITSLNVTGTIPNEFSQLTSLFYLEIHNNLLSGSIPDIFYNMKSVGTLFLDINKFTGNVPPSICALSNLKALHMANNNLSCYPTCVLNAPNPGNTLPVANPNASIPGGGGATYGSKTGSLTLLTETVLDTVGSNTCKGNYH